MKSSIRYFTKLIHTPNDLPTASFLLTNFSEIQKKNIGMVIEAPPRSLDVLLGAFDDHKVLTENIKYICLTHIHLDHASGASSLMKKCPNATLLLHPRAARHMIDPSKLVASSMKVYGKSRFEELYGTQIDPIDSSRIRSVNDGEIIYLGDKKIEFIHTLGHAKHHMVIYDHGEKNIFSGDNFGIGISNQLWYLLYESIIIHKELRFPNIVNNQNKRFIFPSTTPVDFNVKESIKSIEKMININPLKIYLTHYGPIENINEIGTRLKNDLEQYGQIQSEATIAFKQNNKSYDLFSFAHEKVRNLFKNSLENLNFTSDEVNNFLYILRHEIKINSQGVTFAAQNDK